MIPTPPPGDDWVLLTEESLSVARADEWVARPDCGAVVVFSGLVREFADEVTGVVAIDYEAWPEQAEPRMAEIIAETRLRWPEIGRMVLWHRHGRVELSDSSVVVAVSAPHRDAAFAAARFGIDTLKATVPVWKKEISADGTRWSPSAQHIVPVAAFAASADQEVGR